MSKLLFIVAFLFLNACQDDCKRHLDKKSFSTTCGEIKNFSVSQLVVSRIDSIGYPVDYSIESKILIEHSLISIQDVKFSSYDNQVSWRYKYPISKANEITNKFPIAFENDKWYLFEGIPSFGFYSKQPTQIYAKAGQNDEFEKMFQYFATCNCYKEMK